MAKDIRQRPLVRLSAEQLRRSRAGTLGRFPSDDLYVPEIFETSRDNQQQTKVRIPRQNEKGRKRRVAENLG